MKETRSRERKSASGRMQKSIIMRTAMKSWKRTGSIALKTRKRFVRREKRNGKKSMQRRESVSAGIVSGRGTRTIRNFWRASALTRKSTIRSTARGFYSGVVNVLPIRRSGRRSVRINASGTRRTKKSKTPSGANITRRTKRKKKHVAASGTWRTAMKYVRGSVNGMRSERSRKQEKHETTENM